jgi:hypothetical protein
MRAGFDVWVDNAEIRSSDNWWEKIVQALRTCSALVVVMTPEARASQWVQREVTLADKWGKPSFPLLLEGENWEVFVLTQFEDVRSEQLDSKTHSSDKLPSSEFLSRLSDYVPRQNSAGKDASSIKTIEPELHDPELMAVIENPPPKDKARVATQLNGCAAKPIFSVLLIPLAIAVTAALLQTWPEIVQLINRSTLESTGVTVALPQTPEPANEEEVFVPSTPPQTDSGQATHTPVQASPELPAPAAIGIPSQTASVTAAPSATLTVTATLAPTETIAPSSTATPSATAEPTETPTTIAIMVPTSVLSPTPNYSSHIIRGVEFTYVPPRTFNSVYGEVDYGYWMGIYEVTNAEFVSFLNGRGNFSNSNAQGLAYFSESQSGIVRRDARWQLQEDDKDRLPVVGVTFYGAADFCAWLGGRLPSAAEWHNAATMGSMDGTITTYPWGMETDLSQRANVDLAFTGPLPVGSFPDSRNVAGMFDLIGNVWEWTNTRSGNNYLRLGGAFDSIIVDGTLDIEGQSQPNGSASNRGFRCIVEEIR